MNPLSAMLSGANKKQDEAPLRGANAMARAAIEPLPFGGLNQ